MHRDRVKLKKRPFSSSAPFISAVQASRAPAEPGPIMPLSARPRPQSPTFGTRCGDLKPYSRRIGATEKTRFFRFGCYSGPVGLKNRNQPWLPLWQKLYKQEAMGEDNDDSHFVQRTIEKKEETRVGKVKSKRKRLQSFTGGDNSDKRGVCYLSRVPPHMDPSQIRQLLSSYGEIHRIYLAPDGRSTNVNSKKNVNPRKAGDFERKSFSEGWVEFAKKNVAKSVAKMLNNEQIGGRKKSPFYYDIWNIKYLSKFKWDDLIGEIASKNRLKQEKMNMEISAAKRERDFYLSKIDQSLAQKHIQERRKKREKTDGGEGSNSEAILRKVPQKDTKREPLRNSAAGNDPNLPESFVAEFLFDHEFESLWVIKIAGLF